MEWYVMACTRCRNVRRWMGYKTGLGKTEQQLRQMHEEATTCAYCQSTQVETRVDMGIADQDLLTQADQKFRELRGGLFPRERAPLLNALVDCEQVMPELLQDEDAWQSLWIDYHEPIVERVWRQYGDLRINFHRIYHAEPGKVLFHPHLVPSAMLVLEGLYEMAVGYGEGPEPPPVMMRLILGPNDVYEMNHPHGWHSVRPVTDITLSLMVTDKPWQQRTTEKIALDSLSGNKKSRLLQAARKHYFSAV